MSQSPKTLRDFMVGNYIRPKVAFRLKPLLLHRDIHALDLSPLERRQLNRLFHGYDLSHRQLSHAIDVIKKIEGRHEFHYLAPGYGGMNRKMTSYRLAKHILDSYERESNKTEEPSGLSRDEVRQEARRRIFERAQEDQARGLESPHPHGWSRSEQMRSALARPVIPRMSATSHPQSSSAHLARPPLQSLHAA